MQKILSPYFAVILWLLLCSAATAVDLSNISKHTEKELFDRADGYFLRNSTDTALTLYKLQVKISDNLNEDQKRRSITAYNRIGIIYTHMGDYRSAYKNLIEALHMCEEYGFEEDMSRIYTSIGNIYYYFGKQDIAKSYYIKALHLCKDSTMLDGYYNNAGLALAETGNADSALCYFGKAMEICRRTDNDRSSPIFNSVASFYKDKGQNDSAYHYYTQSLAAARRHGQVKYEIQNLSDLSSFFLQINELDSARMYLSAADTLALKHHALKIIASNYLIRANIEDASGHTSAALDYFRKYSHLKDSIFSADIFGDINRVQRLYETAKTDRQIEDLIVKQRVRENIIYIALGVVVLVSIGLLYIWRQKKILHKAYEMLLEKNVEIMSLRDNMESENSCCVKESGTEKKKDMPEGIHDGLFDKITEVMKDTALVCDPEFSINKLSAAAHSNHTYVSQAIIQSTGKNFRAFLNEYRIREAQRIFSSPEASRYTIESVALRVGFKSRTTFYNAFKDITGVTPNFYLKSMQKRH